MGSLFQQLGPQLSTGKHFCGVYEFGTEIGATPLFPWELKQSLEDGGSNVETNFVREDGMAVSCIVRNRKDRPNESFEVSTVCQIWQRLVVAVGHPAGGANMALA